MRLVVQPILMAAEPPKRKEQLSWRPWGGVVSEADIQKEQERIQKELAELLNLVGPSRLHIAPITRVKSLSDALYKIVGMDLCDVLLIYAIGGESNFIPTATVPNIVETMDSATVEALASFNKHTLIFVRHKSGPLYVWYEIALPRFLRKETDIIRQPGMDTDDVIVDDYNELAWRLHALYGLKNTLGRKIVYIGTPAGWPGRFREVLLARKRWNLDLKLISYEMLGEHLLRIRNNKEAVERAAKLAEQYCRQKGITVSTNREFVLNSFLVYQVFKDLMLDNKATVITIGQCMSVLIPMAKTTACLPLSLLNDEGFIACCEGDMAGLPAMILLKEISGKPVFLNDPTFPHEYQGKGIVTLAHCTAPRKMDGKNFEKTKILTHFESDYGAAPKVEMKSGAEVTIVDPDFDAKLWYGFKGRILEAPFLPVCRSQIELEILGDWRRVLREMRGFHWLMVYGDYLKEVGYALKKGPNIRWRVIN